MISDQITFSAETFGRVIDRAEVLGRQHWREFYDDAPFVPEMDRIPALQEAGGFAYFVARTDADEIVGHIGFLLFHSPFHAADVAMDMFYYVEPEYRGAGASAKLLRFAGEALAPTRVVLVSQNVGGRLGPMIKRAGFEPSSHIYRFAGT